MQENIKQDKCLKYVLNLFMYRKLDEGRSEMTCTLMIDAAVLKTPMEYRYKYIVYSQRMGTDGIFDNTSDPNRHLMITQADSNGIVGTEIYIIYDKIQMYMLPSQTDPFYSHLMDTLATTIYFRCCNKVVHILCILLQGSIISMIYLFIRRNFGK